MTTAATYDPATIPQLESTLEAQSKDISLYNFQSNKTLAKLYKCYPMSSPSKHQHYATMLLVTLRQYPESSTDFHALVCLMPESAQREEACASLIRCAELLEGAQFEMFWETFPSDYKADERVCTDMRQAILKVFGSVYQNIACDVVAKGLGYGTDDVAGMKKFIDGTNGASISSDGAMVEFAATLANSKRSVAQNQQQSLMGKINLDSVSHLLHLPQ
eukprot:CAMPEP_0196810354 /NCGR_PEP_ID=MMETSP1362-20130617/10167_1 /TAXON_ID=163516 /ORGANISM="Leptocylindrus danicus, Strain CCMP1856" /LENGTH=217 /DNA_ID=CAMNT_0042185297 /DNA_START=38 /DNA_END=691 /DNA_ORIENTATION=+